MRFSKALVAAVFFMVAAGAPMSAHTHEHQAGALTVVHPWSRATAPSQQTGAVFLRIENASAEPDRLLGVESDLADATSLHTTIRDGDIVKMRPLDGGVDVPAHGHVEFAPGGDHIMLIGLRQPLMEESTIPLTLIFEHAGRVTIEALVEAAGARGPAAADADGHGAHGAATSHGK